ncbi:MAG: alpha-galactosidase [Candidatus Hodarchaeota archaeon]
MKDKRDSLPLHCGNKPIVEDWLIHPIETKANAYKTAKEKEIIFSNGLISRTFLLSPNGATIAYDNLMTGESLIRGVKPEARVIIDGEMFQIGGLDGQVEYGYLKPEWIDDLKSNPLSFQLEDFEIRDIEAPFPWKKIRSCEERPWPATGKVLVLKFKPPEGKKSLDGMIINIHYEMYDGIPLLCKWFSIENKSKKKVRIDSITTEILAVVDAKPGSAGGMASKTAAWPHIYFESDYSFRGMGAENANHTVHWVADPQYMSQVAYNNDDKVLMECGLEIGPSVDVPLAPEKDPKSSPSILHELVPWAAEATWEPPAWRFESFRLYELVMDGDSRERCGLARCQMYRTIAPWITENPLMMHLITFEPDAIKEAIKQMEAVGFELLIFSFGSNFNNSVLELELEHPDWFDEMLEEIKEDVTDSVKEKGFDVGGYSLLASRKISIEDDVVNPYTGRTSDVESPVLEPGIEVIQGFTGEVQGEPTFGNSPCLGSNWGLKYFHSLYKSFKELDLTFFEHDGSYPGDVCASTKHLGHRDLHDSQWIQWKIITSFYKWCRSRGIFLNVPDWYMLTGSNKTGIGYKEVNWSLPRPRQVMLGRQNIYDGTWEKTPSMGWTFCPLTQYHTVKEYPPEVATIEPLSEHLDHYERMLVQNLGSGVQACYRGKRLYDTEETKVMVKKWVDWYKKYRPILESDIVHIRRPDGRDIDGILHVDPRGRCDGIKGLAMFYNPCSTRKSRVFKIPLYYTGIGEEARIAEKDLEVINLKLDRKYMIELKVEIPPGSATWFVIR